MRSVLQDLRYGVRVLLRSPGSTAVAVIALALGIGANTAIFSLVETVLLRPLPYTDADRLVQVWEDASHVGFPRNTPATGNFFDWKAQNQVFEDMAAIAARLEQEYPDTNTHVGSVVVPLRDELVGNFRPALYLLLVAVGCVLLIACANVANLLLSRATARRREMAVRVALGASRGRVIRQLLTESVLLAGAGGALGLAVASWGFELLATLIPTGTSATGTLALDGTVLAFTVLMSVVTGFVFGLAPALAASRQDLAEQLKGAPGDAGVPAGRLRGALVIAEVALAFLLIAGAGLMIQAFVRVRSLDPGFRPDHVLTVRTMLPSPRYAERARRVAFYEQVLARVAALPGVVSAGYTSWLPLTNRGGTRSFVLEGEAPPAPGAVRDANFRIVSADYHVTMGISLRRGRYLEARDRADTLPVIAGRR